VKTKATPTTKKYRAQVSIEFDAANREDAMRRAREVFDGKGVTIKLHEASIAWVSVPSTDAPTS
jgi:hypothetical protein